MKVIKIDKNKWDQGIEALKGSYNLFSPVKQKDDFEFKGHGCKP